MNQIHVHVGLWFLYASYTLALLGHTIIFIDLMYRRFIITIYIIILLIDVSKVVFIMLEVLHRL